MISFGGFLNSNFWQNYRQQSSPSIEDLLSKSDCSVEKLLDDDDVLQEFKNQNQKLLQYFTHDQLKKLIDFITVMPPEDATHARGHKYPFLSAEIFNCELNTVLEKFFEAPEPPSANKDEESKDDEEEEDEEEKANKENAQKLKDREIPTAIGIDDFRPPFMGDDDPENDIQKQETAEIQFAKKTSPTKDENEESKEEKKEEQEPSAETSPDKNDQEKVEEPEAAKVEEKAEEKEEEAKEESKDDSTDAKPEEKPDTEEKSEEKKEESAQKDDEEEKKPEAEVAKNPEPEALESTEPAKPEETKAEPEKEDIVQTEPKEEVKAEVTEEAKAEVTEEVKAEVTEEAKAEVKEEAQEESKKEEVVAVEPETEDKKEQDDSINCEEKVEEEVTETPEDEPKKEESKEESKDGQDIGALAEMTTVATEMTEKEETEDQEPVSKYMLLDRLFKFIRVEEAPLNPVLAGYFCKLLILLINRKQKQIIPYIFGPDSDILECLLRHLYQKSISEVLQKLMNIVDTNFDGDLAAQILEKKQNVLAQLIEKLSADKSDEENMNASSIVSELMELKQFYTMISKRSILQKFSTNAFEEDGTIESKTECLVLLNKFVQQFKEKQLQGNDDSSLNAGDEDDEIIINEASDDEKDAAKDKADLALVEILAAMIEPMNKALTVVQEGTVMSTLNLKEVKPLGIQRLRIVELLAQFVKLNKSQITDAVESTNILGTLIETIQEHPWNNFLQLKTQQIFEDLMESETLVATTKFTLIKNSNVVKSLLRMGENTRVTFVSQNQMRHGYMGFAIKLSNLIKKKCEAEQMTTMEGGEEIFTEDWTAYVEGELTKSNTENARNLGGRPHSNETDEEETNQFDVNMDRIMQRFNCFNSIMQNSTSEDEKGDDIVDEPDEERTRDPMPICEVTLPEQQEVDITYSDAGSYWKVDQASDEDLDALMADLE